MNRKLLRLIIVTLAILVPFFVFITTSAKGKGRTAPDMVIITGPGLESPLEITDQETLQIFSFAGFENIHRPIKEPNQIGVGFESTRYVYVGSGLVARDKTIYYPQTFSKRGYVFYKGLIAYKTSTPYDGKWYLVDKEGDSSIKIILNNNLLTTDLKSLLENDFRINLHKIIKVSCHAFDCLALKP